MIDEKVQIELDQAMDCIMRAADQKQYDNVIYFANAVKEQWLNKYASIKSRKFEFIASSIDGK